MIVDVKLGGLGPGVAVCAHVKVAVCEVACGVQVRPIAGEFTPTVAGALIVRLPPLATANDAVPAGIVQTSPNEPVPAPGVATVTGTVPVPAVSCAVAAMVAVGAVFVTIALVNVSDGNGFASTLGFAQVPASPSTRIEFGSNETTYDAFTAVAAGVRPRVASKLVPAGA